MSLFIYMRTNICIHRSRKSMLDCLNLELRLLMCFSTSVLGTKLQSSRRAVVLQLLNHPLQSLVFNLDHLPNGLCALEALAPVMVPG